MADERVEQKEGSLKYPKLFGPADKLPSRGAGAGFADQLGPLVCLAEDCEIHEDLRKYVLGGLHVMQRSFGLDCRGFAAGSGTSSCARSVPGARDCHESDILSVR